MKIIIEITKNQDDDIETTIIHIPEPGDALKAPFSGGTSEN